MERRTTKPEYITPLLDALHRLGSSCEEKLLEQMYLDIENKLHAADIMILPNGEPRWRYQAQHMLDGLIESGLIIKKDGILWLNENQRI
ncbi:MAG: hypothetical protein V1710_07800 [Candidatus Bathyarchaeota archaeon]